MPFTFSHPALVLPANRLSRQLYSMTGLIIGSMTPDFEYFIRMNDESIFSHSLRGLFYFDLPLGLALCFVFHDIVRDELITNLSSGLQERFNVLKNFDWNAHFRKTWPVVLLSIIIGAASHIIWDSFTHRNGYFIFKFPFLKTRIHLLGIRIPIYNLLQHISSVVGLVVVFFFVYSMPKTKAAMNLSDSPYWIYVAFITSGIMALRFIFGLSLTKYGNVIVSIISAFFLSIIILPLIFKIKHRQKEKVTDIHV